jgi:ribose-phosphate pyrophosphokinase
MAVIGDVKNKTAIILDDMVDTAGTLTEAVGVLLEKGAKEVHACCAHPVLSGPALDRINASDLQSIVVTDTIPLTAKGKDCKKSRCCLLTDWSVRQLSEATGEIQ